MLEDSLCTQKGFQTFLQSRGIGVYVTAKMLSINRLANSSSGIKKQI